MVETNFVPILRYDLKFTFVEEEGETFFIMEDPYGYTVNENCMIHSGLFELLVDFAEELTQEQIEEKLLEIFPDENIFPRFMKVIEDLDESGFMISDKYLSLKHQKDAEYKALPFRPSLSEKINYPSDKNEAEILFTDIFSTTPKENYDGDSVAIIAPHLDFNACHEVKEAYSAAYHSIRDTEADVYVILGTSHFVSTDYFMATEKDYQTPLGTAKIDRELLAALGDQLGDDLTIDEMAHKIEHCIEYQTALLLSYFKKEEINILPILCGSINEEIVHSQLPMSSKNFANFIVALKSVIEQSGKKAVFIASVDFAHIGPQFGDAFNVEIKIPELAKDEIEIIELLEKCDSEAYFNKISSIKDCWRVCGNTPMYALMNIIQPAQGKLLKRSIWLNEENESAVSFASLAYKKV